ncbi:MAG: hypothetical protein ACYSTL_08440 [Planctomycetota bacterium]|jgi:hypothetical protein
MDEAAVKKKLRELRDAMASTPSPGTSARADNGIYYSETSKNGTPVEDSLDHLRLPIKYLMFDLEATRRENRYLRQMLNNRGHRKSDDSKDGMSDY